MALTILPLRGQWPRRATHTDGTTAATACNSGAIAAQPHSHRVGPGRKCQHQPTSRSGTRLGEPPPRPMEGGIGVALVRWRADHIAGGADNPPSA